MSKNKIYHNPRCSKSRQTLNFLNEKGVKLEVVEYLKDPPSAKDLKSVLKLLGVEPLQIIRTKEQTFKDLGLTAKDNRSVDEWAEILHKNPILIERPIVIYKNKAAIGRPPENVLKILS